MVESEDDSDKDTSDDDEESISGLHQGKDTESDRKEELPLRQFTIKRKAVEEGAHTMAVISFIHKFRKR